MKKLLFVFLLGAFAACGGNSDTTTTDSTSMNTTTEGTDAGAGTGTMMTDTTGAGM